MFHRKNWCGQARFEAWRRWIPGIICCLAVLSGGIGHAIDIDSIDELQQIGNHPGYPLSGTYTLTQDLLAAETSGWNNGAGFAPIGHFSGVFDGQGHVIKGLVINRQDVDNVGLFSFVIGEIKNLELTGGSIVGKDFVGALVGVNYGIITACRVTCSVSGSSHVGGMVGGCNGGTVTACCASGSTSGSLLNIGGLFGVCGDPRISLCYTEGEVSGRVQVGGLAGSVNRGTLISDCYARAEVSGSDLVGGFIGFNDGEVTACYAAGTVFGSFFGLAGGNTGTFTSSYWDMESTGQSEGNGGEGRSTAEMAVPHAANTFVNWDFAAIWSEDTRGYNGGYPYLRGSLPPCTNPYGGGNGSEAHPYLIVSPADWVTLSNASCDWNNHFVLLEDLDFSGASLLPLGTEEIPFTGVFNGNGHVMRNAQINFDDSPFVGLFGKVDGGEIRNLGLENIAVTGPVYIGGLAGFNSGKIESCYTTGPVTGFFAAGGLVGQNNGGTVIACYAKGSVNCPNGAAGGLAGINSSSVITSCYATGAVSGIQYVGGLVGYNTGGSIMSSYAMGSVSGFQDTGGLVGADSNNGGIIASSYWDINTSGCSTSAGGEGRTTDEMTAPYAVNTFAGWNFTTVWAADTGYTINNGYPYFIPGQGEEENVFHPADLNGDWRIKMSEAIPYLLGWQRGANPIAYAIRASYLWQNGEQYFYNSSLNTPMCWVLTR